MKIKDSSYVKWPPRLRGDPTTENPNVYYHFHHDIGHSAENCQNLRDKIEELIHRGYLKKYIQDEGCTTIARKNTIQELEHEEENPPKRPRVKEPMYFIEDDARGIQYPRDDALVIKLVINSFEVKRVLVDSGSSADIIFLEAFDKLQLQ
ncbi:PREDICTED: uncharacterized protein LOC104601905 [Nelumbo nucifera]|uniref:Uncharacterized protein LOC104601905 n=1 Tax=Nelumbo nucifera TaxID=4432 RepID=A0A1U8ADW7_NELNU|nr:PREDICTED: uncharacterized protein LOC104601905 [Nelumbo nucifera]